MPKTHKVLGQVISIDKYRQSREVRARALAAQICRGQMPDALFRDPDTLLSELKAELLEIDRAILALTKLAEEQSQPSIHAHHPPQRRLSQR